MKSGRWHLIRKTIENSVVYTWDEETGDQSTLEYW